MTDPDPVAAAWLSEMWQSCRELPRHERTEKRKNDRQRQRELEELPVHIASTAVEETSTGNPEIACEKAEEGAA